MIESLDMDSTGSLTVWEYSSLSTSHGFFFKCNSYKPESYWHDRLEQNRPTQGKYKDGVLKQENEERKQIYADEKP